VTASRYAMVSAVMGVPMVFYGQEQGIGPLCGHGGQVDGVHGLRAELRQEHSALQAVEQAARVGRAAAGRGLARDGAVARAGQLGAAEQPRAAEPNQYFLSRTGGGDNSKIFAVAKYEDGRRGPQREGRRAGVRAVRERGRPFGRERHVQPDGLLGSAGADEQRGRVLQRAQPGLQRRKTPLWATPKSGGRAHAGGVWVSFSSDSGGEHLRQRRHRAVPQAREEGPRAGAERRTRRCRCPTTGWTDSIRASIQRRNTKTWPRRTPANGTMTVWQAYVANLDPTDEDRRCSRWTACGARPGAEISVAAESRTARTGSSSSTANADRDHPVTGTSSRRTARGPTSDALHEPACVRRRRGPPPTAAGRWPPSATTACGWGCRRKQKYPMSNIQ
jgi:hypothetical protein